MLKTLPAAKVLESQADPTDTTYWEYLQEIPGIFSIVILYSFIFYAFSLVKEN